MYNKIDKVAILTSTMINDKKLTLFPIAIGEGANLKSLSRFSPDREPLRIKGLMFSEFFNWLKESIQKTSQSTPGQDVVLPSPKGWATL